MDKQTVLNHLSPEIVAKFRTAIEIGKWDNGDKLSPEQRQTCMQAVMIWEYEHLPINERTGYIPKKGDDGCDIEHHHHYPNHQASTNQEDDKPTPEPQNLNNQVDEQIVTIKH